VAKVKRAHIESKWAEVDENSWTWSEEDWLKEIRPSWDVQSIQVEFWTLKAPVDLKMGWEHMGWLAISQAGMAWTNFTLALGGECNWALEQNILFLILRPTVYIWRL
jgi:hypothetical protein